MKKNLLKSSLIIGLALLVTGCFRSGAISFDTSDPNALTPGIEWAVITEPYAAFRKESNFGSAVASEARRGEIYEVTGKTIVLNGKDAPSKETTWYEFEKGWLDESVLTIYDNKMRAKAAAAKLTK
jgi:hypothetical protein